MGLPRVIKCVKVAYEVQGSYNEYNEFLWLLIALLKIIETGKEIKRG